MTSHIIFTENIFLPDTISNLSSLLDYVSLSLGLNLGLDPNWDGLELYLSRYSPPIHLNAIMFCLLPLSLIGIIYLAITLNLMDRQITNISGSVTNQKSSNNTKLPMNLVCSEASAYGVWNYWSFVYNVKDPSSKDLNKLFDRFSSIKETRFIDGIAYKGYLFRP